MSEVTAGTTVAGYEVRRLLWRLDGITIYEATSRDGAWIALELLDDAHGAPAFHESGRISSLVKPPHTLAPVEIGVAPGIGPYIARLLPRGTLASELLREGPFDLVRALDLCARLVTCVDAVHRTGYAVGRLRCGSVFVEHDLAAELVRLYDFRYAQELRNRADAGELRRRDLAKCGDILYELATGTSVEMLNPARLPRAIATLVNAIREGELATAPEIVVRLMEHAAANRTLPTARLRSPS